MFSREVRQKKKKEKKIKRESSIPWIFGRPYHRTWPILYEILGGRSIYVGNIDIKSNFKVNGWILDFW